MRYNRLEKLEDIFYNQEIYRSRVKTLWSLGHYDGPRSGLIEYNNKIYLAINESGLFEEINNKRIFFIIELKQERIGALLEWCKARREVAGNHCQWSHHGEHLPPEQGSLGSHSSAHFRLKFPEWNGENPMPSYLPNDNDKVIGWFWGWKDYVAIYRRKENDKD
jgi:hypothetical protein